MKFGEYIKEKISKDEEYEAIIGNVDMPATFYLADVKLSPYCYEKYGDMLNSEIKYIKQGDEQSNDIIEVMYDDYEVGEQFAYATAGYVPISEYNKLFIKI